MTSVNHLITSEGKTQGDTDRLEVDFAQLINPIYCFYPMSKVILPCHPKLSHSTSDIVKCVSTQWHPICLAPIFFTSIWPLCFQTAHSPRWDIHTAGTLHGNALHATVVMSCLDTKCQPGQHLLRRVHRGVAESNESSEWTIWCFWSQHISHVSHITHQFRWSPYENQYYVTEVKRSRFSN